MAWRPADQPRSTPHVWSMHALVAWVREGNIVVVTDGDDELQAHVVTPASGHPYLRTFRGRTPTDAILKLPEIARVVHVGARAV